MRKRSKKERRFDRKKDEITKEWKKVRKEMRRKNELT